MKGIVFTKFMELVEQQFGLEELGAVLSQAEDNGVYTTVGSYDHRNLVKPIVQLSQRTGISPQQRQRIFGQSVFHNLYRTLPSNSSL